MDRTIKTAIVAGIFALLGTVAGAAITGWSNMQLARQEFYSKLIMKSLESNSAEERLESLNLLVDVNLIKDSEIKEGVKQYADKKKETPETIPQIRPDQTLERVNISVSIEKSDGIASHSLYIDGEPLKIINGSSSISLTPGNHMLLWRISGSPGSDFSVSILQGKEVISHIVSSIPISKSRMMSFKEFQIE